MKRMMMAAACIAVVPAGAQTAAPQATVTATAYDPAQARAAILDLADELEENFVHPDVAKRYAAMLRANAASGVYDGITTRAGFADKVTADLMAVAPDGHLGLMATLPPRPAPGAGAPPPAASVAAIEQAGMIAPGIAYIRFNGFPGDPETVRQVTAFMDAHAGAKALIVDQRASRGGGLAEMDVMLPRLFAKPATVMVMDMRASVAKAQGGGLPFASLVKVDAPAEFHRAEHRVVPVSPASPWAKANVYVLTAGRTASAAEHFASAMKESGRATLIGETTAGAGNFGGVIGLPGGYGSFVPFGHSYYPGKAGWEGVGVTPTIATPPERALYEALVREGVTPADAERLSESHKPTQPMARRRPLRS